jgi:Tfp pilus assembly protein PilX
VTSKTPRMLSPRLLAEQRGQALIMALGITMVLTIMAAALASVVIGSETQAGRDTQEVRSIDLGKAGLNYGTAYLSQWLAANDSDSSKPVGTALGSSGSPQSTQSVDGGTVSWWATKTASDTWTVYSQGTSKTGIVRNETIQMKGIVTNGSQSSTITTPQAPIYGYGYAMADPNADCTTLSSGGDTLGNSAQITVPIFIASSLCLSGGGSPLIAEPNASGTQTVSMYVGKKYQTQGNSTPVGLSSRKILSATIVGGCQTYFKKNWTNVQCNTPGDPTSGTGSGIQASSYGSTQITVPMPTVDTTLYNSANLNPITQNCAAKTPGGATLNTGLFKLDNDTTRNTSLQIPASSGSISLFHLKSKNQADTGNNFDCRYYDGSGNLVGELTWQDGTPGTLTVLGTAFIDGNLNVDSNDEVVYNGIGVLYMDGTVNIGNGATFCAGTWVGAGGCSTNWNPAVNDLEIVAVNHQNAANAAVVDGNGKFQGILFVNGNFSSTNSGSILGSVIANSGQMSGAATFSNPTPAPPGAPGGPGQTTVTQTVPTTAWNVSKGSWTQG